MEAVREQEGEDQDESESEEDGSEDEEDEEEEDGKDVEEHNEDVPENAKEDVSQANVDESPEESTPTPKLEGHEPDSEEDLPSSTSRSRPLSRSPPASRHTSRSPSTLAARTAALSISNQSGIKEKVASEVSKHRAHQQRKFHSKRGAQKVGGRQKGSKAKMDTRVKPDHSGFWD